MTDKLRQKLRRQLVLHLARRLPPCNLMTPLFSESLERPLSIREKVTVKLHLFTCAACRRYVGQIQRMSAMLKSQTDAEVSAESAVRLSDDARQRIKAALEAAAHNKK